MQTEINKIRITIRGLGEGKWLQINEGKKSKIKFEEENRGESRRPKIRRKKNLRKQEKKKINKNWVVKNGKKNE